MLLARCYNNEGIEDYVEVGQFIKAVATTASRNGHGIYYEIYRRSDNSFLRCVNMNKFDKLFEVYREQV